jgi:hypothetical protein
MSEALFDVSHGFWPGKSKVSLDFCAPQAERHGRPKIEQHRVNIRLTVDMPVSLSERHTFQGKIREIHQKVPLISEIRIILFRN